MIALIVFWILLGCITGWIGTTKGRGFFGWFIYGFFLFPVALIHVLVTKNEMVSANAPIPRDQAKKCPACAEMVRAEATICRYCKTPLQAAMAPANIAYVHPDPTRVRIEEFPSGARKYWFEVTAPDASWRQFGHDPIKVAGGYFYRAANEGFAAGRGWSCELVRQPDNPHDANAVAVVGHWVRADGRMRQEVLGHLSADMAAVLAEVRPGGVKLSATPYSLYFGDETVDLKVKLYGPAEDVVLWGAIDPPAPAQVSETEHGV